MSSPLLVWILLSAIWGSTWLFIKIGLDDLPPFTLAWLRFFVALLPLLLLCLIRRKTFPKDRHSWTVIGVTGLLMFTVNYALVYWAETLISSGLAAVLYTALPLFGIVIAHFHLPAEPLTWPRLLGIFMGIGGVSLIFIDQLHISQTGAIWGVLAIVLATLATAYSSVLIKRFANAIDPLVLTTGQILIALPPLALLGLIREGNPLSLTWTTPALVSVIYLALMGTALTFVLLNGLIRRMAVTQTHLIPVASTLIAVLLGWWVRGETLNGTALIGAVFILCGLLATTLKRR